MQWQIRPNAAHHRDRAQEQTSAIISPPLHSIHGYPVPPETNKNGNVLTVWSANPRACPPDHGRLRARPPNRKRLRAPHRGGAGAATVARKGGCCPAPRERKHAGGRPPSSLPSQRSPCGTERWLLAADRGQPNSPPAAARTPPERSPPLLLLRGAPSPSSRRAAARRPATQPAGGSRGEEWWRRWRGRGGGGSQPSQRRRPASRASHDVAAANEHTSDAHRGRRHRCHNQQPSPRQQRGPWGAAKAPTRWG